MNKSSCLVIAGEKSGEDHAMTFFPKLKDLNPNCEFYGVGGDRLEKQGMKLHYHLRDFSGIGISEVLSKIPFYFKAMDELIAEVKAKKTKTAILIDFQGFNLKLAKKLNKMNVNVLYYVAPQAWVWKPWRAKTLEKNVHTLFTILPFEKNWFQKRGVSKVRSVVHPLMLEYGESLKTKRKRDFSDQKNRPSRILLLPGSRNVEVSTLFPIFVKAIEILREEGFNLEIGIVKTESVNLEYYDSSIEFKQEWDSHHLPKAFEWADLCLAASGTVTLATGLFELPTVVTYKVSFFTEAVLNLLVPYNGPASLTNIIHEKMVFPELIQVQADRYFMAKEMRRFLTDEKYYNNTVKALETTQDKLTGDDFSVSDYMSDVLRSEK